MKIENLPESLSKEYNFIHNQVLWLHALWQELSYLYLDELRVELLNISASTFFYNIQRASLNELVIGIARLSDPIGRGKNINLSFNKMIGTIESLSDEELANNLKDILKKHKSLISQFKTQRNKIIAHSDYQTNIEGKVSKLGSVTKSDIADILKVYSDMLNKITFHYVEISMSHNPTIQTGAPGIIHDIRDALRYRELMDEGLIPDDDLMVGKYWNAG